MLKFYASLFAVILVTSVAVHAQKKPLSLGKTSSFLNSLHEQSSARNAVGTLQLSVAPGESLPAKLNYQTVGATNELIIGSIENEPNSSFSIRFDGKTLDGTIVLNGKKKAYRYTSDAAGNAFVTEIDINTVVCEL
jgi:hypothetical protein